MKGAIVRVRHPGGHVREATVLDRIGAICFLSFGTLKGLYRFDLRTGRGRIPLQDWAIVDDDLERLREGVISPTAVVREGAASTNSNALALGVTTRGGNPRPATSRPRAKALQLEWCWGARDLPDGNDALTQVCPEQHARKTK